MAAGRRDEAEGRARYLLGLYLLSDLYKDECAADLLRDAIGYMPELTAARVALGTAYCRLERYEEMLDEFREAISGDTAAVRESVRGEPEELERLRSVLHPVQVLLPQGGVREPAIPAWLQESHALYVLGCEQIAAGRDAEAVTTLEAVLRLDEVDSYAMAMLALGYLMMEMMGAAATGESMLCIVAPELALLLFD